MNNLENLDVPREEVKPSSAGGAPFLIAFDATILLTALVSLTLPVQTAAILLRFQGNVALPAAFLLEPHMATATMSVATRCGRCQFRS